VNPPSEKQLNFLRNLVSERQDKIATMPPTWILRIKAAVNGELDGKTTSTAIEYIKRIPADKEREKPTPGFYSLGTDVFEVKLRQDQSGVYAMRRSAGELVLSKPEYVLGAIHRIDPATRLSDEEAEMFPAPKKRVRVATR